MDAVDLSELYLDYLWEIAPAGEIQAIVRDAPDLASVSIVATTMPEDVDPALRLACRETVRARYRALTRPGTADGPQLR